MTREDAIKAVAHATKTDYGRTIDFNGADTLVRAIEALGLIKLEEQKTPRQALAAALQSVAVQLDRADVVQTPTGAIGTVTPTSALSLTEAIERAGLKIVRA